ncbi:hypothetical protein [Shouchella shacheensis]|uniref:hypothetical protein n=1 Tax=Shouchella shacheensis TaxID=1649580 RepID=UPI00073FC981|nr:hypothetical protein [Shouchella shacheensis]
MKFHHIGFPVTDLHHEVLTFQRTWGFQLEGVYEAAGERFAFVQKGAVRIELVEALWGKEESMPHVAIELNKKESEIEIVRQMLTSCGFVQNSEPFDLSNGLISFYFEQANGCGFEMIIRDRGYNKSLGGV